jgi:hypothetical protein
VNEERLTALEARVSDLRVDNARLTESVEHLAEAVSRLSGTVGTLNDTFNKGKGAVWLFGLVATGIGGIASWAMTRLFQV